MPSWILPALEQIWSFIAVAFAVNALTSSSKRIAERLHWRLPRTPAGTATKPEDVTWFDIALRILPLLYGGAFGFAPLPTLHVIDELWTRAPGSLIFARSAWFMLAGALAGQIYEFVRFLLTLGRERLTALFGKKARSDTTDPGADSEPPGADSEPPGAP